uniref:Ovule protein n=1 Tax=Panagrellus redivivus TaxID=6233 RepID=A0A7E4ZXZ5_PANRE
MNALRSSNLTSTTCNWDLSFKTSVSVHSVRKEGLVLKNSKIPLTVKPQARRTEPHRQRQSKKSTNYCASNDHFLWDDRSAAPVLQRRNATDHCSSTIEGENDHQTE